MIRFNLPPESELLVNPDNGAISLPYREAFEAGGGLSGYGVPTGTLSRSGFATYTAPAISASYASAQMQIQALANTVQALSQVVAALVTDVRSGG